MQLDAARDIVALVPDPVASARAAHLRYVRDDGPGIRRLRRGKGFRYVDEHGKPVRDEATLARVKSLGIPPAWTSVWICPLEAGHIQATGRDARGRKQYRYHPRWREVRDETKYGKMLEFGAALPGIRAQTERDLSLPGLPRQKVLAAVVRLLERTLIRVGNEEYARQNGSFGLTTMRDEHVDFEGAKVKFHFRGKSGKRHVISVKDRRLARIVRACQDLPGHELFQYVDEAGEQHCIDSSDVNAYLREITGHDFTAKDFRTWAGTVLALTQLSRLPPCATKAQLKKNVVGVIKQVSERLGNTPAVCRKCYVHPAVLDRYMAGALRAARAAASSADGLSPEEAAVMRFLKGAPGEQPARSAAVRALAARGKRLVSPARRKRPAGAAKAHAPKKAAHGHGRRKAA